METYFDYLPNDVLTEILIKLPPQDLANLWSSYFHIEEICNEDPIFAENFWYHLCQSIIPYEITKYSDINNNQDEKENNYNSSDNDSDYDHSEESDCEHEYNMDIAFINFNNKDDIYYNNLNYWLNNLIKTKNSQCIYFLVKYGKLDISYKNYYIIRYLCENNLNNLLNIFLKEFTIPSKIKYYNLLLLLRTYRQSKVKIINRLLKEFDIIKYHLSPELITSIISTKNIIVIKKILNYDISSYLYYIVSTALKSNNKKIINLVCNDKYIDNRDIIFISACGYGQIEIVEKLLSHPKIDPNYFNGSAFKRAIIYNQSKVLEILLQSEKIKIFDYKDEFMQACIKRSLSSIRMLIDYDFVPYDYIYSAIEYMSNKIIDDNVIFDILIREYQDIKYPEDFCCDSLERYIKIHDDRFFKMFENPQIRKQITGHHYLAHVAICNDNYPVFETIMTCPDYIFTIRCLDNLSYDADEQDSSKFRKLIKRLKNNFNAKLSK